MTFQGGDISLTISMHPILTMKRCILWYEMILKLSIGYRLICGSDLNKVEIPQDKSSTCDTLRYKPKIESNMVSTQICIKSCSTNIG